MKNTSPIIHSLVFVGPDACDFSRQLVSFLDSYPTSLHPTKITFFNNLEEFTPWLLLKLLQNESIPNGIVLDIPTHSNSIKTFLSNGSFPQKFKYIPLVFYSKRTMSVEEKKTWVSIKGVDDIFDGEVNPDKFMVRLKFLQEFKIKILNYAPSEEENESNFQEDKISYTLKRSLDILVASFLLILVSPISLFIGIIIKLESKGPIFYKSQRAGANYKVFQFLKFRTMYIGSDDKLKGMLHLNQYAENNNDPQIFVKLASDPRITPFGSFLRNTSLDEIPQLINVIKGDMSLVGNRPLPLYEAVSLTKDEWVERFLAPAGITGLWQITKRGQKNMTVSERIDLDINYANQNSFLYDLWILIKTPRALIQKENV